MATITVLVLLAISFYATCGGQKTEDDLFDEAYGSYPYYNRNNKPLTLFQFCGQNRFNCAESLVKKFCFVYDITCNYQSTATGYYAIVSRLLCQKWCDRCSDSRESTCQTGTAPAPEKTKKCAYSNFTEISPRIFGGDSESSCTNPWVVALRPPLNVASQVFPTCQGVLVDTTTVITTSECLDKLKEIDQSSTYNVTVGDYVSTLVEPFEKTLRATEASTNTSTGIIKLTLPAALNFTQCVSPACLPSSDSTIKVNTTDCRITGWGISTTTGSVSQAAFLQSGGVAIADNEVCSALYGSIKYIPPAVINVNYTDTKYVGCTKPGSVASACENDQGGAVTCKELTTGEDILVGLIKGGGCNSFRETFFVNFLN